MKNFFFFPKTKKGIYPIFRLDIFKYYKGFLLPSNTGVLIKPGGKACLSHTCVEKNHCH